MRRLLIAPLLLGSLGLAGCATNGGTTAPPSSIDVSGTITQIQTGVNTFCGYQVTGQTVANILSALGVPYVGMAADVIHQLCSALSKSGARRGGHAPVLVVRGHRIAINATKVR